MASVDNITDQSIRNFETRQSMITKLKKRFSTYGYKQVRTSTFESYDLYTQTNGLVNHNEMIKTIDPTGQVLVLRPDITIPITRQVAKSKSAQTNELRYFYISNVFRQSITNTANKESTQAGIEYFGNNTMEVDAEVIALAIHILRDLGFEHFKIELGHARFLKELMNELPMNQTERNELKQLIQAKNSVEIEPFLANLNIKQTLVNKVKNIPLLYGPPEEVFERAKEVILNKEMSATLQNLQEIYEVLQAYGVEDYIAMDFGLVNDMDYYSDIIFQGFVDTIGKPILMGGRYDQLADQFSASIPAIGFAFDVETLLKGTKQRETETPFIDLDIYYDDFTRKQSLLLASELRDRSYHVLTFPSTTEQNKQTALVTAHIKENSKYIVRGEETFSFQSIEELVNILDSDEEEL